MIDDTQFDTLKRMAKNGDIEMTSIGFSFGVQTILVTVIKGKGKGSSWNLDMLPEQFKELIRICLE